MTTVDRVLIEFVGSADSVVAAAAKTDAAVAKVTSATKAAGAETAALGKKSTVSFAQMGTAASKIGGVMSKYVSLPIAAAAYESVKMASTFQSSMLLIQTQAGASGAEVKRMTTAILQMAPAVGVGPKALSEALYHLESVGLRGGKALDALKYSAEGAQVGMANLEDVANALGAIMVSGMKGVSGAKDAMGQMNAIVGAGNIRMQDLASAMGNLIPISVSAGLSLSSVGAGLSFLTDMGMPAEEAATRLRMAIALMVGPSQTAAKDLNALGMSAEDIQSHFKNAPEALKKIGMSITTLSGDLRKPDGLFVALSDVRAHLDSTEKSLGLTGDAAKAFEAATIKAAFGGAKMGTAIMALLENLPRLQGKFQQITKASAGFGDAWNKTSETTRVKVDQMLASLSVAAIQIGNDLAPTITAVAKDVAGLAHWFSQLSPGVRHAVTDFALLVATVGPLLMIFGKVASSITAIKTLLTGLKGAQAASQLAQVGASAEEGAVGVGLMTSAFGLLAAAIAGLAIGTVIDKTVVQPIITGIEKAHDVVAQNTEDMKNRFVTQLGEMKGVSSANMNSIIGDFNRLDAAGRLNDVSMLNLTNDMKLLGQAAAKGIPVTTHQMELLAGGGKGAAAVVAQLNSEIAGTGHLRVDALTLSVDTLQSALGISYSQAQHVASGISDIEARHVDPASMGIDMLQLQLGLTHDQAVALYSQLHALDGLHVSSYVDIIANVQQAAADANAVQSATTYPSGPVSGLGYHDGGLVSMHAGGLRADERLVKLQAGEYVMQRSAVRALGTDFLDTLNRKRSVGTVARAGGATIGGAIRGSGNASPIVVNNYATVLNERQFEDWLKGVLYRLGFRNGKTGIR